MILTAKGKRGQTYVIATGVLAKEAGYSEVGDKKTPKTWFSIRADEYRDANGETQTHWLNCECWRRLARYASRLEKGDAVMVAGVLEKDAYWSDRRQKDEYKLIADFIQVQDWGDGEDTPQKPKPQFDVEVEEDSDSFQIVSADEDLPF